MDIKTLVVGQEVWMKSGPYYARKGMVVKVTDWCVEVELPLPEGPIGSKHAIRFDTNGKACDSTDIYDGNMWGGPDPNIPGTHEFGPWELTDVEVASTVVRKTGR